MRCCRWSKRCWLTRRWTPARCSAGSCSCPREHAAGCYGRRWDSLNSQLAVPGLGLAPYCAPLDVRRVAGGFAGDRAPLVLGNQARLEQLETVEEAEDLVPAPWPDPLAGPLIHRHRFG